MAGITIYFKQEIAKNSRWEELSRNVRWESIGPCESQRLIWNQPLGGNILRIRSGHNVICPQATRPISNSEGILVNFANIDEFQTFKYEDSDGNERKLSAKVSIIIIMMIIIIIMIMLLLQLLYSHIFIFIVTIHNDQLLHQ